MSFTRRLILPARSVSRGGFTLVELLVVIGIIALLAGIAMGPITGAMKTAKDNAAMQTTHSLYIADFQYSVDNNGSFADGADAGIVAQALLNGGYITDPTIFWVSGGQATKFTGANAATTIVASNISWDFYGVNSTGGSAGPVGVGTNDPDQLPLIWTTGNTINLPAGSGGSYGTATVNVPGGNPLGSDGIPVVYKSGSSVFKKTNVIGPPAQITQFVDSSYVAPTGTTYIIRAGANN